MLNLLLVVAELPLPLWFLSENSHIVLWADIGDDGAWVVDIRALVSGKGFFSRSSACVDVLMYITVAGVPAKRLWTIQTILTRPIARPGELLFPEDTSIFKYNGDTHQIRVISFGDRKHCYIEGLIFHKISTVAKVIEMC